MNINTNTVVIIISEAECETLNPTWSKVVADPTLPVQHGVKITLTLTCPAYHVKKGGNKAICLHGQLVPITTPPQCSADIGMLYVFLYDAYFLIK